MFTVEEEQYMLRLARSSLGRNDLVFKELQRIATNRGFDFLKRDSDAYRLIDMDETLQMVENDPIFTPRKLLSEIL